jgi:multisubunit Na+/H+ antiporter MnhG subunit
MSQEYPSFSCSKLTTHCSLGGCIIVICLMNGIVPEVYASRMMLLLLAPVSASALSRCSSLLTMRLTTNSVDVCWVRLFF